MIGLQRTFKIMDDDNSKNLNMYEFCKALSDYGLGFSKGEQQAIFNYFDVDNSGTIIYDEFIRAVRGPMNMARKKIVAQAYKSLDKDGNGWVDINDVRGVYNARKHPDVISGKKTEDQILQEFLETFETAHSMRENGAPDHVVTREEFEEYYNNVSCSIDDDMYFMLMINNAWKLTEESRKGMGTKGWANESAQPRAKGDNNIFNRPALKSQQKEAGLADKASEKEVITHLRTKIAARGARGLMGLSRKFKIADDNNSKTLDAYEFKKAMHDFRIGLSDKQVTVAFNIFDRDGSGEISYDEFLRSVRGQMNLKREGIARRCFKILDNNKSGLIDVNDVRQSYNAKQHPDVKAGKKTEDEVLMEFLDTFEDHYADMKGHADSRDGSINMVEWLEYYNNVSMSIDDDAYFELMMNSAWNLDGARVTKKGWGAEY
uniref:EF-hand domain-containing protein n=1 Tax=Strombidium rassoulzadegani TaxID=1082188 RepID=A0A7S3FU10_9SPIT|mmetsp:Transcript_12084/g.20379  ORF Transcript_12084/g.20379 Transcript_12084/m.20379 type:complete len:432 (+) Transcript_12084:451-1746(+)